MPPIAHLSPPISRTPLADTPALQQFVQSEMLHEVERALEYELIQGDGTGEHMTASRFAASRVSKAAKYRRRPCNASAVPSQ